ncbi:xaa-Pro aminopeptidase [Cryptococcus neoformans C23]|uniref:Xaa-Pro aminopeptidase n=2 Tax=Cryptococcus neoformans TaxID=5207 RepID=A0A854QHK5_CRYNE|nr:xaa-Pro aminopeptidase [Cryptococcus neoformans var. grubii H99]AUB28225.1 xaa-Pro aminopeptidase [Cryptococcus neoformans var. grubii]OWZ30396.1 xaa-Pro aminopeptidase [Cryptococcus neoformans var. grubii AD1-83a]OWZ33837.1 xaa-Pro aminopeptidase [Cryptococcus neoformans var. grubii AD2-60a]OWZ45965.1 xaa-Pro aminopeptidase [Cryptococcus neoformans var. grubii C23]OWZ56168.1 xaa-Pro aminopeptidase [Cryptococcus neoformans var. grubii 125.91]OXC81809.1 xaa-Pro aminopeptidase [Cryptococcus |eukprot:XP_012052501.1 xaa-Pro aminopeptidase [Cryptococcus neoformans var. grubii H99]
MAVSFNKLAGLRQLMREQGVDAYVVPSEDAHASEYLAPCDARRAYITGFTGSAGCAVITHDKALCWTDGRYWLQAEKQLGEGWALMKSGLPEVPTWSQWLSTEVSPNSLIGIDPTVIPYSEALLLHSSLPSSSPAPSASPSRLIPTPNLIDSLWVPPSRPLRPSQPIFHLADKYTGEPVSSKLRRLRDKLIKIGSPGTVVASLDEIAWVFNLRGADIPYNPVFFAYTIITPDDCTLFVSPSSLTIEVRSYLHANGVAVLDYSHVWTSLEAWKKRLKFDQENKTREQRDGVKRARLEEEAKKEEEGERLKKTDKILIGNKTSWAVAKAVGEDNVEVRRSLIEEMKAKKNATEIEGFRQCHIRDGAALVRYLAWLEEALENGESWTEYDAATKLEDFRKENKLFMGLSFETISSTGANAAVIHYSPPEQGSKVIEKKQMYLCDSGAQYLDGTTDVTRTLHFGTPNEEQKRAFTRVLQGHISLDTIVFPQGTTGYILDVLARRALWSDGLDYRHSTSHGIGSFLNVHEGPQGIGQRPAYNEVALQEGMVISNEPGYYKDGEWGIRIEGVDVIERRETRENFGGKGWLGFERITMCPIQRKLVDPPLLTIEEKDWLNEYHAEVLAKLAPVLKEMGDERAGKWLERECQPL